MELKYRYLEFLESKQAIYLLNSLLSCLLLLNYYPLSNFTNIFLNHVPHSSFFFRNFHLYLMPISCNFLRRTKSPVKAVKLLVSNETVNQISQGGSGNERRDIDKFPC